MFPVEALTNKPLHIGRQDTNETIGVLFDVSSVRKAVPGATFTLMFAPHGTPKEAAYPIPLTDYDADHVLWLVTAADTAVLGAANAQVFAVSGEKRWKSQFYTVLVEKSLGTAGEAPDPVRPYVNVILEARDGAVTARVEAVEAKTSAETARDEAVTAKTEAQTLAQSALTSAQSAQTSATEARQSAEEAKQDYTALNTKVEGMYTNEQIDQKIEQATPEGYQQFKQNTEQHIGNSTIHVTDEEKARWNNPPHAEETDPTVPSYVKAITQENINSWNNPPTYDDTELRNAINTKQNTLTEADKQAIAEKAIDDLSVEENRTWSASHIAQRFGEVEMAKFPNVTIFGQPTIQQGQISNFSATNYCQFPFVVNFQNQPFEIDVEITTGSDVTGQHNILDSEFGLAFAVRQSRFVVAISTNGTNWNIGEGVGTHVVTPNTTYRVRMTWDLASFVLSYSADGGSTYVVDITKPLTVQPYPKQMLIGVTTDRQANFNGIINLNYASLSIAYKLVWQGMDDVGLATRADVSLSNLDELGEQRIRELAPQPDLTEYVKNTDYATATKAGLIKPSRGIATYSDGTPYAVEVSADAYKPQGNSFFIGKGTLENLIGTRIPDVNFGESENVTFVEEADLEHYVKDTDYAEAQKAGVSKINSSYGITMNSLGFIQGVTRSVENLKNYGNEHLIAKGTLENVLADRLKEKEWTLKGIISGNADDRGNIDGGCVVDLTGCTELYLKCRVVGTNYTNLTANGDALIYRVGQNGTRSTVAMWKDGALGIDNLMGKYSTSDSTSIMAYASNAEAYSRTNGKFVSSYNRLTLTASEDVTECSIKIYAR